MLDRWDHLLSCCEIADGLRQSNQKSVQSGGLCCAVERWWQPNRCHHLWSASNVNVGFPKQHIYRGLLKCLYCNISTNWWEALWAETLNLDLCWIIQAILWIWDACDLNVLLGWYIYLCTSVMFSLVFYGQCVTERCLHCQAYASSCQCLIGDLFVNCI